MPEEPPERPNDLSPFGSLPGEEPQQTPEERAQRFGNSDSEKQSNKLKGFIDFDELDRLNRDEKVQLVQNICERFVFGHLNGMSGTVGYSDTLRPEVNDRNIVSAYRNIATNLWGQGQKHSLPYKIDNEDLEYLKHIGTTDKEGNTSYFESIIKPPKEEADPKNPYLSKAAYVYHDARLLDSLIKELYIVPSQHVVGFSKN